MTINGLFPVFINNGGSLELWLCKIVDGLVTPVCGPEKIPANWMAAIMRERNPKLMRDYAA
jgi:hypothetical protein